jgi:hypothetical protein
MYTIIPDAQQAVCTKQATTLVCSAPMKFLGLCLVTVVSSLAVFLLAWMIARPVRLAELPDQPAANEEEGTEPHGAEYCPASNVTTSQATSPWDIEMGLSEHDGSSKCPHLETSPASIAHPVRRHAPAASMATGMLSLPGQLASQLWRLLSGSAPEFRVTRSTLGVQLPLTKALLLAHNRGSHKQTPYTCLQPAAPSNNMSVPYPLLDWRSARARCARWHKVCRQLSRASSEADVSVAAESSIDRSTVASQATVPGGLKGHNVGRSGRKQLAGLVAAVWLQRFDKFGAQSPLANVSWYGAKALVELCDALKEIEHIPGISSLLRRWPDNSGDACSDVSFNGSAGSPVYSSGANNSLLDRAHSTAPEHSEVAGRKGVKVGSLPELGMGLRHHANCVEALAHAAPMLRNLAAAADLPDAWPTATHSQAAWHQVCADEAAAWTFASDSCSCTAAGDKMSMQARGVVCAVHHMHPHDPRSVEFAWLSFGLWCVAVLLQLAAIEPRPELWGRYVAALNPLQGVLQAVWHKSRPGNERQNGGRIQQGAGRPTSQRPAMKGTGWQERQMSAQMGHGSHAWDHVSRVPKVLEDTLCLVLEVEQHIKACGASRASFGPAAAFSKGKENIMPLIKRYKALLSVTEARPLQASTWNVGWPRPGLRDNSQQQVSRLQPAWRAPPRSPRSPNVGRRGVTLCEEEQGGVANQSWLPRRHDVGSQWSGSAGPASSSEACGHSFWRQSFREGGGRR